MHKEFGREVSAGLFFKIHEVFVPEFSDGEKKKDLDNTLKSLKVNGKLIDLNSCDTKCSVKLKNDINNTYLITN